ncbi:DEAD/DEAH box helicase family protein [Rickettsiales bacterium]|nr:DEAD/DEAH box helicase family protein [Rickettsiales bacterium]
MAKDKKFEELPVINVDAKLREYRIGYDKLDIPSYISNNLKYSFFDWQKKAFENLLACEAVKERENANKPTHLMFNMATGTGKTLLMASAILYYYNKGYRHFLFFVNQNNIVDKTENNFIDNTHTKYLFKEKIIIDDKTVNIKKIDVFSDDPQGIEIKFTSIQKLYNDIHLERENQTALDDLHRLNIVMLADEAHHLNTETKKKKGEQEELDLQVELKNNASEAEIEKRGWEHTIIDLILNKNYKKSENKNILLEFTATIPTEAPIVKKYEDKIIYKFGLKEFLQAGYTKEINLISSTLDKKERVLQALLFGWYRHKIALKNNIANFKPVVLFRSKTIDDSKTDYEEFLNWIDNISSSDFDFLKNISNKITQSKNIHQQGRSRTESLLEFIKTENINFSEIANWIKQNYQEKNIIITNSKDKSAKGKKGGEKTTDQQDKLINSLEDKNNHIRAIFTVDRLTEGWDVLNLFDIVRLYQGQNTGGKTEKTPESTTKEKQLIGRGVRYFPFAFNDKIKNKRKFDNDLKHELRILEELYYYTYDEESRYISHLKEELRKEGYFKDNKITKDFALKKEFQESDFYKNVKIWYNKPVDNPNRKKKTLEDVKKDFFVPYRIKNLEFTEQGVDFEKQEDLQRLNLQEKGLKTIPIKFKHIEKHIIQKAINIKAKQENSLFQFETLKEELDIETIDQLRTDKLADFDVNIIASKDIEYNDIDNSDKLDLVIKFLDNIFAELKENIAPKVGGEFIAGNFKKFFSEPKTKTIEEDADSQRVARDLEVEKWYVLDSFHGTSEERGLIKFIQETIGNLEKKYKEIYLLRNEEVYKIYDFEKGRGFQPDFILFLKTNDKKEVGFVKTEIYYQIFIEPKGSQYLGNDGTFKTGKEGWKEEFLDQITEKYGSDKVIKSENPNYRLIGLPFFNEENSSSFKKEFKEELVLRK